MAYSELTVIIGPWLSEPGTYLEHTKSEANVETPGSIKGWCFYSMECLEIPLDTQVLFDN